MKKLLLACACMALCALTTSCDKDNDVAVTKVTINPVSATVTVGQTAALTAKVLPSNATDASVTWGSSNTAVATVSDGGIVTGVSVGTATITAKAGDVKATAAITVAAAEVPVTGVGLSKDTISLFVGATQQLVAAYAPTNATNVGNFEWSSASATVATVDQTGLVMAVGDGETKITAKLGDFSAICVVKVSTEKVSELTMPLLKDVDGKVITVGATGLLTGDQVKIEDLFNYTSTIKLDGVNAAGATFTMPDQAPLNRSYKITVMRGTTVMQTEMLRYSNETIRLPYALGYYMTGNDEVVKNDDKMLGSRHGYIAGKLFTYDESTKEFVIYKADANLYSFTETTFDMSQATGVTSLDPLYSWLDFSSVVNVNVAKSQLEALDMTKFPNAETLEAGGDAATGYNGIKSVNFGTAGTNPVCKLNGANLNHNQIAGTIDLRNCQWMINFIANDNKITGINLGQANTDQMLVLDKIDVENNKIREVDINNCGRIRRLKLAGNPIERLWLTNNTKGTGLNGNAGMQWMYLFKCKECFSLTWATAAEATGERVFNVEHYWWRVYSDSNAKENTDNGFTPFDGGWVTNNPIVQALADGVKVVCWTYHGEDNKDSHAIDGHEHAGGSTPCTY